MSGSDAILVGEGWISEHYFTTDATSQSFHTKVLERRKAWDAEAKEARATPRSRFTDVRQKLERDLGGLTELTEPATATDPEVLTKAAGEVYEQVLDVLELRAHGLHVEQAGPVLRISAPGITEQSPLAVVLGAPVATVEAAITRDGTTLLAPYALVEAGPEFTSAARLVSALFVADDAPELVLLLIGRWALLAERERWAEGRYLAVDLQLVCERNDTKRGGEIDRALTCLSYESIAPGAEGSLWWHGVLADSVRHTVGVSKDLREGVRLSIEIIANDVVSRRRAKALEPLPGSQANELAKQSLRFLYRILFLLYAEASPELGVLPTGAQTYDAGYSLDRLRDLVQVELATPQAVHGTHLYDSLGILFRVVDTGHSPARSGDEDAESDEGLQFNALRADLFSPKATAFIDAVGLGNAAPQAVLGHLLLSKEKRGRDRGFISYAELGINQLGAVYEGLMSYTGFFAETDLYEVAKGGDASRGSWVVPVDRSDGIAAADFVKTEDPTGEMKPVIHYEASFVYRLSGRDRQQSASYYTPEVLTRFTVSQALEELLDQDGMTTAAEDILTFSVCEPALGSGAFAIEAVRQLAEEYLQRRQKELRSRIDPDQYPRRLQEVKAYLALHNAYGVDLNPDAVELAEISLWLDTMLAGLDAPWFGLHLRRGNSLIGARRAVYRRSQVADKSWLTSVPRDLPLTSLPGDIAADRVGSDLGDGIHHFLLPADGWGAAADAKEAASLVPDAVKALKAWRGSTKKILTKTQVAELAELASRVETLWQISYRRLDLAEREIRRTVPVWGAEVTGGGAVQREQIEESLADESGAYRRLRRVMDAWTALWFWPLTEAATTVDGTRVAPPTVAQWIAGLQALLGRNPDVGKQHTKTFARTAGQIPLSAATSWEELGQAEILELGYAGARPIEAVLADHRWLVVCERIAQQQGFFHWNLEFATVFARGGFDLQVGNPPWVRPIVDVDALLAEGDPWWKLTVKPSQTLIRDKRVETLAQDGMAELVVDGATDVACTAEFVGSLGQFPHLQRFQPDLYRCFMQQTWRVGSGRGTIGLIHLDTHFTDDKGGLLRAETYRRLRRHWEFINELELFEIQHQKHYGVNVYGRHRNAVAFSNAVSLYHPDTVARSLLHDGSGPEPGFKDDDGNWDQRPHRGRITRVTDEVLATWHAVLEDATTPISQTRMVYAVNRAAASALDKLSGSTRIATLELRFSSGWHETADRKKGYFETDWGAPDSWDDVILQGPHLFVGTPLYKTPNKTMLHHLDWSETDFEALAPDAIPVTAYKPVGDRHRYDCGYTDWGDEANPEPARDHYRIAWRCMAANTGERTLIPTLIPPGAAHVDGLFSAANPGGELCDLVALSGSLGSLVSDFAVRVAPKSTIRSGTANRLAYADGPLRPGLILRTLRLSAITDAYADLWAQCWAPDLRDDFWTGGLNHTRRPALDDVTAIWSAATPLRIAADRRQALVEIDAIVALSLDLTADELCTIYRTQFAILYGYDRNTYFYDANGRLVPNSVLTVWRKKGDRITADERTATNQAGNTYVYELPFVTLDREADMRQAYAEFERRLAGRS